MKPAAHSLVVCTYNRRRDLERCLASLLPDLGDAELIVIDDGSTDDTPAYLASLPSDPRIKLVRVANQGLSVNRDLGARLSTAPWITYLDDDAWVPPGWLARLHLVCARLDPGIAAVGGAVRLPWTAPPPAWLHPDLVCYLTQFAPSPEAMTTSGDIPFVGANMTLRRDWLERIGGFAHGLGRRGGNLLSREETQLWNRLHAAGAMGYHDPELWIWHDLPPARLRRRWFLRRLYWEGVSWEIESADRAGPRPSRLRRWIRAARRAALGFAGARPLTRLVRARNPAERFKILIDLAFQLGVASAVAKGLRPAP